ncbi:hypothetical protein RHMOL_Rhmol07G0211500 [Rhododendron molle]|uniref:Uncharacterized protein n=1 Tax=Rhododendron molle TaxID=49168 RepID=A0ACC0N544_RHOML|nr:hypothetical protein RHMOL_Rhmol07G0211500 [Rhododendron molle]
MLIRRSNPEVQTLTLRFFKKQSVNPIQSEAIESLSDQGGEAQGPSCEEEHRLGDQSFSRCINPGGFLGREIHSPAAKSISLEQICFILLF